MQAGSSKVGAIVGWVLALAIGAPLLLYMVFGPPPPAMTSRPAVSDPKPDGPSTASSKDRVAGIYLSGGMAEAKRSGFTACTPGRNEIVCRHPGGTLFGDAVDGGTVHLRNGLSAQDAAATGIRLDPARARYDAVELNFKTPSRERLYLDNLRVHGWVSIDGTWYHRGTPYIVSEGESAGAMPTLSVTGADLVSVKNAVLDAARR